MPDPDRPPATQAQSDDPDPSAVGGDTLPAPNHPPPPPTAHPRRLGRYRLLQRLGAGGMGAVFLAFDEGLRRRAALKVMLPKFAAVPSARERFLREARTCARVRSEHVVTIHDVGEDGGVPFIAMEYLQGYPLDEYLKKHEKRLSVGQVLRVGREAAEGLAAAHALGLVHRDVKPGNLWLEAPNGRVKILDFGLAKPVAPDDSEGDDARITVTGAVLGTPAYMSPEQANGLKLDHRTDLFSLGGVLYRLATGRLPFKGATTMAVLTALATETPPAVRSLNPDVPPALADLIHQLLAKDAAHRPASAAEVAEELARIERRLAAGDADGDDAVPMATAVADEPQVIYVPIQVTAYEPSAFDGLDDPSSVAEEVERPAKPERPRRGGWGVWAAAAATVLLVGVIGAVVWRKLNPPKPAPTPDPTPDVVKDDGGRKGVGKKEVGKADPPPVVPRPDPTFFNGKDLAGWTETTPEKATWAYADGQLTGAWKPGAAHGVSRLRSDRTFRDFELSFKVRTDPGGVGKTAGHGGPAVVVRGFDQGDRWVGVRVNLGPKILGTVNPRNSTGDEQLGSPAPKPAGNPEFNDVTVRCVGRRVTVRVNGVVTADEELDVAEEGRVAWAFGTGFGGATFRDIRLADLVPPADPTFFNGKDLAGWDGDPKVWAAEGGAIVGRRINSHTTWLIAPRRYSDFELSFSMQFTAAGWIRFRSAKTDDGGLSGPSVWIGAGGPQVDVAELRDVGDPKGAVRARFQERDFHDFTIRCEGRRLFARVDGTVLFDGVCDLPPDGFIGWMRSASNEIVIRDIRFTDLTKPAVPAVPDGNAFVGWKYDPNVWKEAGGEFVGAVPAGPVANASYLHTEQNYRDFDLSFRYRAAGADQVTSVMIRGAGRCDLGPGKTGVLWMFDRELSPASAEAGKTVEAKKPDEYNDVRVRCAGPRVTVTVNGVVAVEKDVPEWTGGAVGWRVVPRMTELRIRDVRLTDLSTPVGAAGPWRPAFAVTEGELKPTYDPEKTARFMWENRDGEPVLVATGGGATSLLGGRPEFKNAHLRFQYRWPPADYSHLSVDYFRAGPLFFGYSHQNNGLAKVWAASKADYWADPAMVVGGRVEPVVNAPPIPLSQKGGRELRPPHRQKDDAWHTLELVCLGDTTVHRLDGVTLGAFANCRQGEKPDPAGRRDTGTLTLSVMGKGYEVRRIEVREVTALPPEWFAAEVLASPDWEWAKIENLGDAVNGPGEEKEPTMTADGLRLVFTRAQHLYESARKSVDEPFAAPRRLDELVVPDPIGLPFLLADGLTLMLVVQPPGEPRTIWASKRPDRSSPWGKPEKLGDAVNTKAGADDPALSADGLSLFFARSREKNGRDLWVSRRAGAGAPWGEPEWLGPDVNTDGDERRPWPLPDGGGFTFSRLKDGVWRWLLATPKPGGGWDVRVIRDRAWYSQAPTADGRVVVVSSATLPGGRGGHDLWQIRRVPKAKPDP